MPVLDGAHHCKKHQSNTSHYDTRNCEQCQLEHDLNRYMAIAQSETERAERLESVLLGIKHFDCYTREGEEPPAEAMRRMAASALAPKYDASAAFEELFQMVLEAYKEDGRDCVYANKLAGKVRRALKDVDTGGN